MELGEPRMEEGSQGKVVAVLTDPAVVSVRVRTTQATSLAQPDVRAAMASPAWTAEEILTFVATSEPPFHALIDTGALITGMDNVDVARFLLDKGLPHVDACVYLDEFDRQKIVVRGNPAPQSLHEVGVPVERRFVFYDQIHHTGIDIPHAVNARAAVTIGKDMTLREYSQGAFPRRHPLHLCMSLMRGVMSDTCCAGCWRMRGIGCGQTIVALLTPEVASLVANSATTHSAVQDVLAWLFENGIWSEQTQFKHLCVQDLAHLWRRRAFNRLLAASEPGITNTRRARLANLSHTECVKVFSEAVSFALPTTLSPPERFSQFVQRQSKL